MAISDNDAQKSAGMRRRVGWLALVALIIVIIAGLWQWRLALAEAALTRLAAAASIELRAVTVDRLGFTGIELSDVRAGPDGRQTIARIRLGWSVSDLLARRVRSAEIAGAHLHAVAGADGGIVFEGLPAPTGGGGQADAFAFPRKLPFQHAVLTDSEIAITLPDGQAELGLAGSVDASDAALAGDVSMHYAAQSGRGEGRGAGTAKVRWSADGNAIDATFDVSFDRLVAANFTAAGVRVSGNATGAPQRPQDVSLRAAVAAETVDSGDLALRDIALDATLADGALDVRGKAQAFDWSATLSAAAHPFDLGQPANVSVRAEGGAATLAKFTPRISADGTLAVALDTEIDNPANLLADRRAIAENPALIADHVAARFNGAADLRQLRVDGELTADSANAAFSGGWRDGLLTVDLANAARATGVGLAPALKKQIAAWLPNATPFDLAITAGMGAPATARLRWTSDGIKVRAIAGANVSLPKGTVSLAADGAARLAPDGGPERLDVAAATLMATGVPTSFGVATGDLLATDLAVTRDEVVAVVGGSVTLGHAAAGGLVARRVGLALDGRIRASPKELALSLAPGGSITIDDGHLPEGVRLPGHTRVKLATGDHTLSLDRSTGRIAADLRLAHARAQVALPTMTFGISEDALALSGEWPGRLIADAKQIKVRLDADRSIAVPRLQLRANGSSTHADVTAKLEGAVLALPGLTLPPLDGEATLSRRGPKLDGTIEITAAGGQPRLKVRGEHDLASGRGRAEIVDAQVRFAPGVLQPQDLSPLVPQTVKNVFATISLSGPIAWQPDAPLAPALALQVEDLSLSSDAFDLSGATGSLALTGLPALASPPGQTFRGQLRVGRLGAVPFEVSFQLLPAAAGAAPQLVVEGISAQLADGRLTADRFTLTPPNINTDVTLRLDSVDLARAFALIGSNGIGGTGRISGAIPLKVRGKQIAVVGGRLASDGPGTVYYDLNAVPQPLLARDDTVSLVLRALSNFAYDSLQAELDKALEGPGSLRLHLTGANPDVLESQPFIFNIAFESNFDRLADLVIEGLSTSQGLLRALALSAGGIRGAAVP